MRIQTWQLKWFHTPTGRKITANYGTETLAKRRRRYIQANGDRCSAPERIIVEGMGA